jgi:DNA mismatch repair protein MutS
LSLAWAAARQIAQKVGAFTLFATHYFELTSLPDELPACRNVHLDATEHGRDLVFLHAVKPGPASQSYGLHVAELAGVPRDVVDRAREYLRKLERHQLAMLPASPQTELRFEPEPTSAPTKEQRAVLERIASLQVDDLTPRAALDVLYELVRDARPHGSEKS